VAINFAALDPIPDHAPTANTDGASANPEDDDEQA
jgi:hypothetical protein